MCVCGGCVSISPLVHTHILLLQVTQQLVCHPANHLSWLLPGLLHHCLKVVHKPLFILQRKLGLLSSQAAANVSVLEQKQDSGWTHHQSEAVLGQDPVRLNQPVSFDAGELRQLFSYLLHHHMAGISTSGQWCAVLIHYKRGEVGLWHKPGRRWVIGEEKRSGGQWRMLHQE